MRITTSPDGLQTPTQDRPWGTPVQPSLVAGVQGYLDDYTAVQWGLAQVLGSLTMRTVDARALVESGQVRVAELRFHRVYLDHPDDEDERAQVTPSCTISEGMPTQYDLQGSGSGQRLLESTVDQWAPGTVLARLWEPTYSLAVTCWLANKDDRAAVRKALVEAFGVEPLDPRSGRRLVLPWYWDQTARYDLTRISYPDSSDLATRGTWPLVAEVTATTTAVQLVQSPGYLVPPQPDLLVAGDLT